MAQQAQPPEPKRSQSTTSLSRLYNGPGGSRTSSNNEEELNDPKMDFCNSFWGQGDRGFEVIMARLRGAGRTVDEMRGFWRERAAIEEDYAKRLNKLSKHAIGKDEIGDLSDALQHLLNETAAQGAYHASLGNEIRQTVENPTVELAGRLSNLKKGLQASIEKGYKNKGLQEQHVQKARDRYEQDCLKLNSYTAQSSLTQGKELEKLHTKLDRVRQTIGANEQDFRQFVRVLEQTQARWESEWKGFCDHVQDLEEDRLALTKDLIWVYANAVSQVCVEDDSSCERIREKLEQFEPQNDMLNFVKGWGTGDMIPDPPRFINYNAGESYPTQPAYHVSRFQRLSSRPPMPPSMAQQAASQPEPEPEQLEEPEPENPQANGHDKHLDDISKDMQRTTLKDEPPATQSDPAAEAKRRNPFGGVALPGMANPASPPPQEETSNKFSSMPPPPTPPTMTMPEPRIPSRQGNNSPAPRNVNNEEDPMAKALADLRREPPPPGSVRRNTSHRRPESVVSASGSTRNQYGGIKSPASPGPNRISYQQSMAPTHSQSRGSAKRQSVNYSNFADDIVGAHPTSRPSSPSVAPRAPSPAMMQPPTQPATHIADEVLSQYHQAFPGERQERSRSRAGSVISSHSRAGSFVEQQNNQPPPSPGREAFAGIGAGGGRSPSPQPPVFRSPSPSPMMSQGSLGPQNLGISLDAKGGVAQDTMAEQYRRQFEQQQAQQGHGPPPQQMSSYPGQRNSQYGQQSYGQDQRNSMFGGQPPKSPSASAQTHDRSSMYGGVPKSPMTQSQPPIRYNQPQQQIPPQPAYNSYPAQPQQQQYPPQDQGYGGAQQQHGPPQPPYGQHPSSQSQPQPQAQYPPQQQSNGYGAPQQQYNGYQNSPSMNQQYGRSASPAPQQQYARSASPAPQSQQQQQQQYGYNRGPSPQPQYGGGGGSVGRAGQSPSPQPNQPPNNAAPTGQWSTTGLPVLFYVKALYDYGAQSSAEFDFQAGDIIAVTSTPEDGWWSGELLDEARRIPGRTDFPSNL
uniref:Septation protein imp2 n=1 Tax=Kwoniella dejecticola CBS 10117 TaxID=1296121 RepID=A0A1A6A882_9TREE|nr:septation protein imp2 [Kwoniella dejecticola CBS 10117]OBR86261.1 septation protein imp2 [Kwoniella dejecticola CBS 10117]